MLRVKPALSSYVIRCSRVLWRLPPCTTEGWFEDEAKEYATRRALEASVAALRLASASVLTLSFSVSFHIMYL